jgi:hypothetical protein
MNRKEAARLAAQENILRQLGFTASEAESLRRISTTLRRWHEMQCGIDGGCIERDDDNRAYWYNSVTGRRSRIADRESGALRRLSAILAERNDREAVALSHYVQTDPRGAALYVIRPGDVPDGADVGSSYSRGICVY